MIRTPWYGLWWVVLLQYTHVVHTSMSILNCPTLPNKEGMKPVSGLYMQRKVLVSQILSLGTERLGMRL